MCIAQIINVIRILKLYFSKGVYNLGHLCAPLNDSLPLVQGYNFSINEWKYYGVNINILLKYYGTWV
jgi:hypothetical protein